MQTVDAPITDLGSPERVHAVDPLYWEIVEFLNDEALLLDRDRLDEWLALLTEDLVYWMPVRVTRDRAEGDGFSTTMGHFDDNYASVAYRVRRLQTTTTAWAEDPASRVRRLVSGVTVFRTLVDGELRVVSSILAVRSRWDRGTCDLISAERHDLIRRTSAGLRLARRDLYIDQSTLGTSNLAIFL
jgi:3-phenylpropionate/cinnamic acid dioxygenase small subunit